MRLLATAGEGIPHVARWTGAAGDVVDDVAESVLTASPRAGILALVPETGLVARTLQVEDTFWATSFVRVADVLWQTFALAVRAYRVWPTGRWTARVADWRHSG